MNLLAASLWLSFFGVDHDVKMARFTVEEQNENYEIAVSFDRVDILEAIYGRPTESIEVLDQIGDYVERRVAYKFDGRPVPFQLDAIEYTKDNILLNGIIHAPGGTVHTIEVENTCLLDEVDGHMNIMEFFLSNHRRYFRLHEGRTKTIVDYD
ncbi:MAG: DUF6702 family protein [Bacteroidota bacterium]